MNTIEVLNGQLNDFVQTDNHPDFEADTAVPFPLQAVLKRFRVARVLSDDIGRNPDAMELAVLFNNTFDDSVSLKRVKEAQQRADERINNDDYDGPRQQVRQYELVAAYGRDYAFDNSVLRRQYDAAKWYTTLGLYHLGEFLIDPVGRKLTETFDTVVERISERLPGAKQAVRSRIPGVTASQSGSSAYDRNR